MIGISIKPTIGIGDALQYSSLPENYYRAKGEKILDVSRPWFFDHNPFVLRDSNVKPTKIQEMWNFSPKQYEWPIPRKEKPAVYLNNAEIWATLFGVPCEMSRPRLYRFEEFPFEKREMILLHTQGISHGVMPDHIVEHVLRKYKSTGHLWHVGPPSQKDYGLPKIFTPTLWDLAAVIAKARMFIGVDSGPSWIAACYPDVVTKKIRMKPTTDIFKTWVPLEIQNIHAHWDDRCHQIFNPSDKDIGFTYSYTRI